MPPPDNEEEEDYMSMIIEEPQQKETFSQKKLRKQREAEARAKVPSKAERAAQDAARRDAALSTSTLDPSNKGFQMMAKLGFKPGEALGKRNNEEEKDEGNEGNEGNEGKEAGRSEPLNLVLKEDRGGIGLDSERKRKFREVAEEEVKRVKQDEGDYRDRVRAEREARRTEGMVYGAQKVAEKLDLEAEGEETDTREAKREDEDEDEEEKDGDEHDRPPNIHERTSRKVKPTAQINVLYRGIVREREDRERSILARHALQTSLPSSFFPNPKLPGYEDGTLEREDRQALGTKLEDPAALLEQELDEEDPELDAFNALEPAERLHKLVLYLREKHWYCFWCKYGYDSADMEGCPGVTEEDHD